jgi:imidazolonepropionase-like amidohydrolase
MSWLTFWVLVLAGVLFLPATAQAEPVLYRNATLIDGSGAAPTPAMSVLVEGERIVAVGTADQLSAPANARVVDLSGKYLMPGLIDSHVHLATPPNRRRAEALLRRDLYGGVTAVRDMADDLRAVAELARASLTGEIAAPDIRYAALMAGPSFFDDPRTRAVSAGVTPGRSPWMQAIGPDTDVQEAVTLARGTSATAVKIYANLPPDRVAAVAAEARRQGLQVWAHTAVYPTTPGEVVAARPHVMSHACSLGHAASGTPATYQARTPMAESLFVNADNPAVAQVVAAMAEGGVILDATASIYGRMRGRPGLCTLAMSEALTRQAHRAGVTIAAGTDWVTGSDDPWPTLHQELAALKRSGLTALEVIQSATLNGARAAGAADEMGTIAPGKLANMIVLARDPVADLENLRTLEFTVKRGRVYLRDDFRPLSPEDLEDAP